MSVLGQAPAPSQPPTQSPAPTPAPAAAPEAQPPAATPAQPPKPDPLPPAQPQTQPQAQPQTQPQPAPAQAPTTAPAQPPKPDPLPPAAQPQTAPATPATAPAQPPATAAPAVTTPAPQPEKPKQIVFNFKDTPFDMVLDFFSRESGLPMIKEAAVPAANMTFIGAAPYQFDDALSILNLNLAMHGVQLRKQDKFLYLATLVDSGKKPGVVAKGEVPAGTRPEQILTLTIPLDNAQAAVVAEQIKGLIGPYGGVTAVPQQNMIVVTETAAQCRRIREIVSSIDVKQADTVFRVFPLKNAPVDAVFNALRGLMGERVKHTVVDPTGKASTVSDITTPGLNIQPDPRTSSIIAIGSAARLRTCEELIALLDTPDGDGDSQMMTFTLRTLSAEDAAAKVNSLFANVAPPKKPTILPLAQAGKVTIVGPRSLLAQAMALLSEIDPGAGGSLGASLDSRAAVVKLKFITPQQIDQITTRLLTPRQTAVVKFAPTPDAKGVVVSGPADDVAAFEQLISGLDVAPDTDKEVRLVKITKGDIAGVVERARGLYAATGKAEKEPVTATVDVPSRTVTLIGARSGLTAFDALLTQAQANVVIGTESRTYTLAKVKPSTISGKLTRLARPMLAPQDGSAYTEPTFEALDELGTLVVRAEPAQIAVLEGLIKKLDADEPGGREFRVVKLSGVDPAGVIARAQKLYTDRTAGLPEAQAGPVSAEWDEKSGALMITARPEGMRLFNDALTQAQQLTAPARSTRMIEVTNVAAKDLVAPLAELLKSSLLSDPARRPPEPLIQPIERTNSLLVTAEEPQLRVIEEFVHRLDKLDRSNLPPLKLLQVKTADAAAIATMLTQQYGGRSQADRASKPVDVRADAATNTLIVSAHADLFEEIKSFVEDLNKDKKEANRVTQLFPLKVAKATDVATAMDKLYPQPPMPVDRLNRPMPWAQQPKEVTVSAEPSSNSLIIDAPADRQESLKALAAQLDRVELPPVAQLRTYHIIGADLKAISQTLQALARQGTLSGPPQPGKPQMQVLVETEPKSSTLIVAGDEVTFERVETMLKDLQAVPVEKGLRIVPIANAKAAEVKVRAQEIYNAQIAQIPGANPIELSVDEASNSLMVVADTEAMQRFSKVLDELQRQQGPAREVRMIELRNAKAAEVIQFVRELVKGSKSLQIRGGPDPVLEPIETTNSILVAAQPMQFAIIESLVKSLDNQRSADRPPLRILKLRTSDAPNLATVLQSSYDRRPPEQKSKLPVEIQADPATNTLIVSAHAEMLPEIEAIVTQLNEQQAMDAEGREIRIFPLKVARAEELAKTIDQMYPEPPMPRDPRTGQPRPDLQRAREIVVRADRGTNSLIVDAPAKRLSGFEQIVKNLDQQKVAENLEMRTYRVERADLAAVASTLKSLAAAGTIYGANPPGGTAAVVTVDTEPTTRTLIVSGPSQIFTQVESVLKKLDGPPDRPLTGLKMYPLKHARAERLQTLLERILTTRLREQQNAEGKGVADLKTMLEVASDSASNTLLISAPEGVQKVAEELIKTLDTDAAEAGRTVVRVMPLNFAEAAQLMAALNQTMGSLEFPSGGKPAVLSAPGSNALILTGAEADLNKVEELVKTLDVRPTDAGTAKIETFQLKNSDAAQMAQVVQRLLSDQQDTDPKLLQLKLQYSQRNRPDLFKPPSVRVEADPKNNTLIVSAPAATLELAKQVIERLDQAQAAPDRTAVTFTPAHGDPATMASTVSKIVNATIPQGRAPLELVAEPRTGSILALGTREQVAEALKRLADYDDRSVALPQAQLEIIVLKNADASSVAPTVQAMLSDRSRWPETLRQVEKSGLSIAQPVVNADAKGNRLLVSAPAPLVGLARELVAAFDQPQAAGNVDVRVFTLEKGEAASVATALKAGLEASAKPGEPKPTVTAEAASNTLIVSGTAPQLARAEELIKPMDESVQPDGLGVRTIFLKHARAEAIAPVLESVLIRESGLEGLPPWVRAQVATQGRGVKEPPKAKVSAEKRLNAIVVSGPIPVLDLAEQVIGELDADQSASGGASQRAVRVITLRNADAQELSTSVGAIFAEDATEQAPTVRVDKSSNSLIVRATTTQMATIEELAGKLDSATLSTSRQLRTVPIDRSRADAAMMARTLKKLLEQQKGVKVEVISTEDLLKKSGLKDDDEPPTTPKNPPKPPGKGKPKADAGAAMGGRFAWAAWIVAAGIDDPPQDAPGASQDGVEEPSVTIAVDPASNSLVIVGSPRATDRLVALAQELEKTMPAEPTAVHIVTLPAGADGRQIAQLVQQVTQQVGRASTKNLGGFSGTVTVVADPDGDALIVLANDHDFETIGPVIASVAQAGAAAKVTVKIYPLSSVTAVRAAAAINDFVSPRPQGAQARRMRHLDVTIDGGDGNAPVTGTLDAATVRVTPDPGGAAIIVAAPSDSIALLDRFVALIDQSPVIDRLAIRRYTLANARATDLSKTLQTLMDAQRQGPNVADLPQARFIADERTNSMLVTASDPQHAEVTRLLETADAPVEDKDLELAIITLQQASPTTVQKIVEQVVIGRDAGKKEKVRISAEDGSSLLVVRAPKDDIEQIRALVKQVDSSETTGLPVRPIKLEKADAQSVATALQKFFTDRAAVSSRPGAKVTSRVAVVGDRRSGTLVVAASDEDFEQIQALASTFDTPSAAQDVQFRIVPLKNARVMDVQPTLTNIADQLQWERATSGRARQGPDQPDERLFIEGNERTNSLVLVGSVDALATIEKVVASLDQPPSERAAVVAKAYAVTNADPQSIKTAVERAMMTPGWRPYRGQDPDAVLVEIDKKRKAVLIVGKSERVEQALVYVKELDSVGAGGGQEIQSIQLRHARADRAANSLRQFFAERARAQGSVGDQISVIGSQDGNVLIVSADEKDQKTISDLVAQIDLPDLGKDRRFEIYYLKNSSVQEAAQTLRQMFGRGGESGGSEQVVVTPQPSTNSIIVGAPAPVFDQVAALVKQIDQPPTAENSAMTTVTLGAAKAAEVAQALKAALPPNVKVTITPVGRSNSLLLTGSDEAVKMVLEQIKKIDTEPAKSLFAFRRFKLEHAMADDVFFTVSQMLRARARGEGGGGTANQASVDYSRQDNSLAISAPQDQIEEIEQMVRQLDIAPSDSRKTEFVKLQFADSAQTAKALEVFYGRYAPEAATPGARAVTIVPDPGSNSLIVSAENDQWDGIRALLTKLDTKDYDTTRQLGVIHLNHADAQSVARALNDGFRAPYDDRARREAAGRRQRQPQSARDESDFFVSTFLIDAEGNPSVSAELQTNSLVVFAGRRDMERIQSIITQLDQPGFANMAEPRVIPLTGTMRPSALANAIREMFLMGPAGTKTTGPRSVVVMGDDVSGALIVRADDTQFAQIKALAETLQQKGEMARLTPDVIRLKHVPAARLRQTLLATFTPLAQQMGETLAVEVDRGSNSLVVMCSPRLRAELTKVVAELDVAGMGEDPSKPDIGRLGQNIFIADVTNNSPAEIKKLLDDMGLSKPQAADRPGVVTDPITIVPMTTRRALAILANPGDGQAVVDLVKALDAEPAQAEQKVAVIALKKASVQPLIETLKGMLKPADQSSLTGPAQALAEQVRRLALNGNALGKGEMKLDLAVPIRLIPDVESNTLILASSAPNVAALSEIVKTLDTLPVGEAVIVRMFPLANASATRIKGVIEELFKEGEALRRIPGTRRQGLPSTTTGQALAGEIAVSVDERTNLLIVAGRDEAVAFVEVLVKDLDSDETSKWIEPAIVPLKYADAVQLSRQLRAVLVQGTSATPEAIGLQKQFGRLRMAAAGKELAPSGAQPGGKLGEKPDKAGIVEADLFAPVTSLVITPEEQSNSLIVVGTPGNIAVVKQLVGMLDVELAAATNTVRVFPLKFAAADRVAAMMQDIFRQRDATGAMRAEDKLIVAADARTNSLIVTTSPRSFAVLEGLLKTVDGEQASASVGLHVLSVEGADVKTLAPRIQALMRERIDTAIRSGAVKNPADAFSIEPEATNNLLIVAASDENYRIVKELVETLSKDSKALAAGMRNDLIQLGRTPASEVVASLKELYINKENAKRGSDAVTVTANDRLNALIVGGTEQDIAEIRRMVARMDAAETKTIRSVERIELKSANALELVRLLENVLAGRPLSGTNSGLGGRQATKIQFYRGQLAEEIKDRTGQKPTEADVDGIIRDQVTLTPDLRSNSIVVAAPPQICKLVRDIVEDLDSTSAGDRKIEQYHLKNADARQMAELLKDTFNLRQQGTSYVLLPSRGAAPAEPPVDGAEAPAPADSGLSGTAVTAVPDERQQLSIAIDARTNSLIVSGTERYLELVRKVVTSLDGIEAAERERTVYNLRNAKAKDMESTLGKYFKGDADVQRQLLGPQLSGSIMRQLEQEVTVVGDDKSNKLVISTSPRFTETVLRIVEELDSAPPQVMIQVLLAEVTIDNGFDFGVDFRLGPFNGPGLTYATTAGGQGVANSLGVPNLSVTSADFSLLVRALEAQGKLEILSNPQLLISNNQTGKIQVGEDVAIVEAVERTPQGGSVSDVTRQDIGVLLNVTPTINADGFVRMEIKPEISALSTKTTQISPDVSAPIITKRTLDTIVSVKDGQSVVIGGLIQNIVEDRESKVPLLGDIPVIGIPFRTVKKTNTKTELLVVLTPRIVPGAALSGHDDLSVERLDAITNRQIERVQDPRRVRQMLKEIEESIDLPGVAPVVPPPNAVPPGTTPPAIPAPAAAPSTAPQGGSAPPYTIVRPTRSTPVRSHDEEIAAAHAAAQPHRSP